MIWSPNLTHFLFYFYESPNSNSLNGPNSNSNESENFNSNMWLLPMVPLAIVLQTITEQAKSKLAPNTPHLLAHRSEGGCTVGQRVAPPVRPAQAVTALLARRAHGDGAPRARPAAGSRRQRAVALRQGLPAARPRQAHKAQDQGRAPELPPHVHGDGEWPRWTVEHWKGKFYPTLASFGFLELHPIPSIFPLKPIYKYLNYNFS